MLEPGDSPYTLNKIKMRCALVGLMVALGFITASFFWLDVPTAILCRQFMQHLGPLGHRLGSPILVFGESLVAFILVLQRILRGRLPQIAKVTVIACGTSLSTFALNEVVLKPFFGVPSPYDYFYGDSHHAFHFFEGSLMSSFPSGHMALAASFTGTFMGQSKWLFASLATAIIIAAAVLVVGDWHFISDVVAGALVGTFAGVTAAVLWARHRAGYQPL